MPGGAGGVGGWGMDDPPGAGVVPLLAGIEDRWGGGGVESKDEKAWKAVWMV